MDASTAFPLANGFALLCWIFLIGPARWLPRAFRVMRYAVPLAFTVLYIACLLIAEPVEGAGFRTLEEVSKVFTRDWMILGGWVHYLAFDFFIGCWILDKSKQQNIAHWLILVPLALTFMFGPVGLSLFLILLGGIRWQRSKNR